MAEVVSRRRYEVDQEKWEKECAEADATGQERPPKPKSVIMHERNSGRNPSRVQKSKQVERSEDRPRRRNLPLFDRRDRMAFPKDPNKYRVWITDIPGQVQAALATGFDFVMRSEIDWVGEKHPEDGEQMESRVCLNVGRTANSDNTMAYLMQIDMEDWLEIKAQIHEDRNQALRDIHNQNKQLKDSGIDGVNPDYGGYYGQVKGGTNIHEFTM